MVTLRPRNSKKAEKAVATAAKAKKKTAKAKQPAARCCIQYIQDDQAEAQPKKQPTDNSDISYYESF